MGRRKKEIDTCVKKYTLSKGIKLTEYEKYGKTAPLKRNIAIIENVELVLAFGDGVSRGIPIKVFYRLNGIDHSKATVSDLEIISIRDFLTKQLTCSPSSGIIFKKQITGGQCAVAREIVGCLPAGRLSDKVSSALGFSQCTLRENRAFLLKFRKEEHSE